MKGRNSVMIGIRVSDSVNTRLKELADKKGLSISAFIKWKVEDFVSRASVNTKPSQDDVKLSRQDVSLTSQPGLPIYNPAVHPAGTHVLIKQGKEWIEAIVPDLDDDGHVVPW